MNVKPSVLSLGFFYLVSGCGLSPLASNTSSFSSTSATEDSTLVVIGDSLSSGVFSQTTLGNGKDLTRVLERSFGSIGEAFAKGIRDFSISKDELIHIFEGDYSKVENSVFFTNESYGLRQAIAQKHGLNHADKVPVKGAFKWGSRFNSSDEILNRLLQNDNIQKFGEDFDISQKPRSYVALSFGANDYCNGNSSDTFKKDLENTITTVKSKIPNAHFILVKLSNMDELSKIDHNYNLEISINKKILNRKISINENIEITSCHELQQSYCKRGFEKENLWQEYNQVIDQVIASHSSQNSFSTINSHEKKIEPNHLSVDCFHPSKEGHVHLGQSIKLN